MSGLLFIDTSVLVEYLVDGEKAGVAEEILLGSWVFLTSPTVYREALGALALIVGREKLGIKGKHSLRKFVAKKGWEPFSKVVASLNGLLDELGIVIVGDSFRRDELYETMKKYNLMPSDAQIVLTCQNHNVKNIATFDSDFKRVSWLKTLGV
ncbi:nucleotide-binding protein [Thermococcus profundus]|uniref:Nucleotide-binding protein n=1 Tax=Thermococcus profundus TaxID=49899 RepID=A0A2Z2M916_THEPR|nr:nucleotide-binding protein [Thermococcus profundus]